MGEGKIAFAEFFSCLTVVRSLNTIFRRVDKRIFFLPPFLHPEGGSKGRFGNERRIFHEVIKREKYTELSGFSSFFFRLVLNASMARRVRSIVGARTCKKIL